MLGRIIGIEDSVVELELNAELDRIQNLNNLYVVMEDANNSVIGEIICIKGNIARINMVGEIIDGKFVFGVIKGISFNARTKLVPKDKINLIIGIENYDESKHLYLGDSPIYEGVRVGVDLNKMFSGHLAIFGSTGSGKSCSVARIIQNLFNRRESIPYLASFFIFDAYGEYHSAFEKIGEKIPGINFKAYTTNVHSKTSEILSIPPWLLTTDDYALLLGATKNTQLPIIEKALKLVNVFCRSDEETIKHKNDIIARTIIDVLSSGGTSAQIRDQIFSILSHYSTSELNLETPIVQPGYTRTLKQCLIIDASGKLREMELVTNFMQSFLNDELELSLPDGSFSYTLKDLGKAFEFALISEGTLNSSKIYDDMNVLKVRVYSLINSDQSRYFEYPEYITKDKYIRRLLTAKNGGKAQIVNFNINYIDDRLAKTITKIYSRLLFDFSKENESKNKLPFHIVLEEAHRYVQNDSDAEVLGYNIFDRITKEGRKYGTLLTLISQRPSELSETSLSQCANFLIFKMLHPNDVDYIKKMIPNITNNIVSRLRILQPGICIGFGSAFKVPTLIKVKMPNPEPTSDSCDISNAWFIDK